MTSEKRDTLETLAAPAKKRRIQRACDICRQNRKACDGMRSAARKCSFCVDNGMECTYSGAPTTTKRQSYAALEARLALTEKSLRELTTEGARSSETTKSYEWSKDSPVVQPGKTGGHGLSSALELIAMSIREINQREPQSRDADENTHPELLKAMDALDLEGHRDNFMGKSSGATLVRAALDLKEQYMSSQGRPRRPWTSRREEYWTGTPWAQEVNRPRFVFPPPDLLSTLVDLYFEHCNVYIPLLHRSTFDRALAGKLHLENDKFGANVISVCAIASRFSNDPRAFDGAKPLSCGWDYFSQIKPELEHLYVPPTLYDLQRYCLALQFLDGSAPEASWTLVAVGIRMAQQVGAHRRQNGVHTVEAELWRRAFWVLVSFDRSISCSLGRPCAMQYDDFDIELPTECDDEYWEDKLPVQVASQPPGLPSRVAFFNSYLRLNNIFAFVLQLLYKKRNFFAVGDHMWEEQIVAELDSALNKWVDGIPEHLRWDPHRADPVFFKQSVALYANYYHVQMTTHRPFIPMVRELPTTLPSLAICTNAARSCARVVDVWQQRMGDTPAIILLPALTTACMILLLNVWSGKRTGLAPHMNTTITEVHKCMQAIRVLETRWQMAGLSWDILNELANVGQVPLLARSSGSGSDSTTPTPVNDRKRVLHGEYSEYGDARHTYTMEAPVASGAEINPMQPPGAFDDAASFAWLGALEPGNALPMYGADLGHLSVFPPPSYPSMSSQSIPYPRTTAGGTPQPDTLPPIAQSHFGAALQGRMHAENVNVEHSIDSDVMAIWSNAPMTFGADDDWGSYFGLMNKMSQEEPPS